MIRFLMGLSKTNNFIRTILDIIVTQNSKKIETINIKNSQIKLYETNSITKYRNDTFFIKEPETLEWINSFEKNENFWDVGANVGLYSIYAAIFVYRAPSLLLCKNVRQVCTSYLLTEINFYIPHFKAQHIKLYERKNRMYLHRCIRSFVSRCLSLV